MVLLRIAIGWHLLYEGYLKFQTLGTPNPWTSEYYLRASTGPLQEKFRDLHPDFEGKYYLDPRAMDQYWNLLVDRQNRIKPLSDSDQIELTSWIKSHVLQLEKYLRELQTQEWLQEYRAKLELWKKDDVQPKTAFETQRHRDLLNELTSLRAKLVGRVQKWDREFLDLLRQLSQDELAQLPRYQAAYHYVFSYREGELADYTVIFGLMIFGGGMFLGLFSRLCSLGAAVLLGLFYISMPPFPGLPENPMAEGNYLIVNKNLIELLACLMLANSKSGIWGGLDAFIRGFITRPLFGVGSEEVRDRNREELE